MTTIERPTTANDDARPAGRPRAAAERRDAYPRWPVIVLAGSAFVAIWGGWVELGRMSGFGPVNLLPGIAEFYVDLAITLPLGMEVYAAYAMGAWLTRKRIAPSARVFAKWSALASLVVGGAGQVAYHLLAAAGIDQAPWQVVVIVSCVPVAVLGMASALAHRLHVEEPMTAVDVEPPAQHDRAADEPEIDAEEADAIDVSIDDLAIAASVVEPSQKRQRGPVTPTERARILELGAAEWSERAIAREVGRSRATVARILARPADDDATLSEPAGRELWPATA